MLWASVLDLLFISRFNEHLIGHCRRTSIVEKFG